MHVRFLSLLIACVLMLALPRAALSLDLDVREYKLDNGLEIVVIPDHRAPVVTHMVWYRVGSADEPPGKSGLAHFLEHLMFKGTPKNPGGSFSRIVRVNGGEENAFTTEDYTAYFQRISKDRLSLVMELEADRMKNLVLTDEIVRPELQVVLEERRQRIEDDPASLLGEQIDAVLYNNHPYAKPVIGWMNEVMNLTYEDALAFYREHYQPQNAVVVVAGDVDPDNVLALARQYYGPLTNTAPLVERKRPAEPPPVAARRIVMKDSHAGSPVWQRIYIAPSYASASGDEALALDLFADTLGGGTNGRLYRKLVVEQKLASYAGAWYSGDKLDYGSFGVYAVPLPGVDPAKLEEAVDSILEDALSGGISQTELNETRDYGVAQAIFLLDKQEQLARLFGTARMTGQTVRDVLDWDSEVMKVTTDDVMKAAKAVLDVRGSVTGLLLPEPGSTEALVPVEAAVPSSVQN